MDRPLDNQTIFKRRRRRIIQLVLLIGGIIALFFILSAWISPTLNRNEIQTAIVERGSIEGSVSATGMVVPKLEQAISSPGETRLLAVRKRPGELVKKGDPLLDLDRNELTLTLDRTEKELALKANLQNQLRLDIQHTLLDLESQLRIKELQYQYLGSKTKQSQKLLDLGAISKEQMEQALLDERIASIEQDDLKLSIKNTGESLQNKLDGLTTEYNTLLKEKADVQRQLEMLSCKAGQDGVVTWIIEQVGASVHRGDIIARVADLNSYQVEATVSDIHASHLIVGMPARIRVNDLTISGKIQTVYPTIENGIAKLVLSLDDAANNALRPNLRVDVSLVTSKRDSTLKVRRGQFINSEGRQDVFIVYGSLARRMPVKIGVTNFDEVEILEGVAAGDELIISDMNEYKHLSQIKIH
jgi:HlyD family secretion protein